MVNGSLWGAKEQRSFKPQAEGSIPSGRTFSCEVSTVVQKRSSGRLVGKQCVPQRKSNARKKPCTTSTPAGTLTRKSKADSNTVASSGRIGSTALNPGSYRATITARMGNGASSNSRTATFTILRG